MQFKNDITRKVAEEAAKIMAEALKGNQHKIDKNKNNKVDAEDFKILRGEKKANEEVEQVDELNKSTLQSYAGKVIDKTRTMPQGANKQKHLTGLGKAMDKINQKEKTNSQKFGIDVKKEEVEEIDEAKIDQGLSDEDKVAARTARGYNGRGNTFGNTTGGQFRGKGPSPYRNSNVAKSGERKGLITKDAIRRTKERIKSRLNMEEVEQLDELSKTTLRNYLKGSRAENQGGLGSAGHMSDKARSLGRTEQDKEDGRYEGAKRAKRKLSEQEIDEAKVLWPGTPEYEKKFPKDSKPGQRRQPQDYGYRGKGEEHGETSFKKDDDAPAKRGKYGARQNYVRSRKVSGKTLKDDVEVGFTDILEAYDSHGLKFIAAMMKEEPDNAEFTKEIKDQKDKFDGKKKGADIAKASVQAVKQEETEIEEGVLGSIAAGVGSFIGNKIDPTHGEMLRTHGPEVVRQLRYHATNAVNKVKKKINREEVEQVEEKTLTEPETAKKEEIVKSMKKGVKGFKQRYGENAKSVMYATATKIAKEKA